MNHANCAVQHPIRRKMAGWAGALAIALFGSLSVLAAAAPPPLKIDLNAFDAMKKKVALPDGETLAYIDTGNPSGPPVMLIHGYTDNARDWVPLMPYLVKELGAKSNWAYAALQTW